VKQIDWNQKKLDKLAEHLEELEIAEQKLQEAMEFINAIGEKWERRLAEKRAREQKNEKINS
jgi:hypothetical protein